MRRSAMDKRSMDNQMNLDQLMELKAAFQRADRDGGGSLDLEEFLGAFGKVLGRNLTREQIAHLYMKIDANSDGSVDWDEFTNFMLLENQAASELQDRSYTVEFPQPEDMTGTPGAMPGNAPHSHKDMIEKVLVIPSQDKVLSSSRDGTVRAWHSSSLAHLKTIRVAQAWVTDIAYFPMSNRLATSCIDRSISFFDANSYEQLGSVSALDFSPLCLGAWSDGGDEKLAVGDDIGTVTLYSISAGSERDTQTAVRIEKLTKYRRHADWVTKVCFYEDLNALVSCSLDGTLKVAELERRARDARSFGLPPGGSGAGSSGHRKGLYSFDWSPSFKVLASCGLERSIPLWNPYTRTGKPFAQLTGHNASVCHVAFHDAQQLLISCSVDKTVKLWDMRMQRCLQTVADKTKYRPEDRLSAFAFDSHRGQLFTASTALRPWPLIKRARRAIEAGHDHPVIAALYNPNFHQVVSGDEAAQVCVWDLETGELAFHFTKCHSSKMTCMAFDDAGRRLITGGNDGSVRVWNFSNGQCLRDLTSDATAEISSILFLTEMQSRFIVAGGWNRKVLLWRDESHLGSSAASPERAFEGHTEDILSIAFLPPNRLATSGYDGTVYIWNLDSGVVKHSLGLADASTNDVDQRAIFRLVYLRHRTQALCGCGADGHLRFWSPKEGTPLWEQHAGHKRGEGLVALATDCDNTRLYTGDTAGCVKAWNISNFVNVPGLDQSDRLRAVVLWQAHEGPIASLEFFNKGDLRFLLSSSSDHAVKLWSIDESGKPLLAATFGRHPWSLGDPSTYVPVADLLPCVLGASSAADCNERGAREGGHKASPRNTGESPTKSTANGASGTDPTGLAAFVASMEMQQESEPDNEEKDDTCSSEDGESHDHQTRVLIDNILARGKEARSAGSNSGATTMGGRGALSHNPVMHRLKVHGLAEVQPRTPR